MGRSSRNIPSDFLDNLANESGLLGESSLPAGNARLGVTQSHSAIALVDAVGEAFLYPPKLPSAFVFFFPLPIDLSLPPNENDVTYQILRLSWLVCRR